MPVDVLCPPKVMQLFYGWQLNLWLLLALWLRMCWTAFIRIPEPMKVFDTEFFPVRSVRAQNN